MKYLLSLLSLFLSLASIAQSAQTPPPQWQAHEVLVRFSDDLNIHFDSEGKASIYPVQQVLEHFTIEEVEQLFPYAPLPESAGFYSPSGAFIPTPRLDKIYRIALEAADIPQESRLLEELESLGKNYIEYVEYNYLSELMGNQPNDTLYPQQWSHAAIQADTVQKRMAADSSATDTNTVIAIIDTGVDKDHLDLKDKMWVNLQELNGSPGVDDDQNGYIDDTYGWDFINNDGNPMDDNSHGTHCAGIAAASTNNSIGVAGVSPGAKIMAVKVMQSGGFGAASDIAQGILYAANNGADILSMSIGGTAPSLVMYNALAVAYAYAFPVAAAGNNNKCIGTPSPFYRCPDGKIPAQFYPAAWSFVLGVESSNQFGGKSGFSNYDQDGPLSSAFPNLLNYEVRAPGSAIISSIPGGSSGDNNRYKFSQGTSMACPAVAGGIALLKAFRPTFTHEKVFLHLIHTQTAHIQLNDAIDYVLPPSLAYVSTTVVDTAYSGDADYRADAGETLDLVLKVKNLGGYNPAIYGSIRLDSLEDPTLVQFIRDTVFFGSASEYAVIENNYPDSAIFPFQIKLDSTIANARGIKFVLNLWTADSSFSDSYDFSLMVQNGIEFGSAYYSGVTTLYPDKYYLISGNTLFDTLIIKPGTEVFVESNRSINAHLIEAIGTVDSIISISGVRGAYWKQLRTLAPWGECFGVDSTECANFWANQNATANHSILRYVHVQNLDPGYASPWPNFYEVSNCIIEYSRLKRNNLSAISGQQDTKFADSSSVLNGKTLYWNPITAHTGGGLKHFYNNVLTNNWDWRNPSSGYNSGLMNRYKPGGNLRAISSFYTLEYADSNRAGFPGAPIYGNNVFGQNYADRQNARNNIYPRKFTLGENGGGDVLLHLGHTNSFLEARGPDDYWAETQSVGSILRYAYPKNYFLGGKSTAFYTRMIKDYFDATEFEVFNADSLPADPLKNPLAHGYVVDIKVNGISTHWLDKPYHQAGGVGIIGNGRHLISVEFNRAMDTSTVPLLTFGIRDPYTQNIVADSAHWSPDGTQFHAYILIDPLTQSDGINRLSVREARDDEGFPCPTENVRFEFRIASTGSLSAGFTAVGDTGKINLNWSIPDDAVSDYLGTNMYRIDSTDLSKATYLYNRMSIDSALVDSTVLADVWYGYYFKVVRTNLSEMNSSDTVWAQAWKGSPEARTLGIDNLSASGAKLSGKAKANYLNTQVRFNYGPSTAYGTNTVYQSIGNGSEFQPASVSISGLQPGTTYHYRLEAVNDLGTSFGADSSFTTKVVPTADFSLDPLVCRYDTLDLQNLSTTSLGSLEYAWELRRYGSLIDTSSAANPQFIIGQTGNYSLSLTVSGPLSESRSKSVSFSALSSPTPSISASGSTQLCQGSILQLNGPNGYSDYRWSNGDSTQNTTVTESGTYYLIVANSNGCEGLSNSITVQVDSLPQATITSATGAQSFCSGSSLDLEGPTGMTAYEWQLNGQVISGASARVFTASSAGSYRLKVTNTNGCEQLSSPFIVQEDSLASPQISYSGSLNFCAGDSVVLMAPAAAHYLWSNGDTTASIVVKQAGNYSLQVSNNAGCTASSTALGVTVYQSPSLQINQSGSITICQGQSISLNASPGFSSYLWSNGATTASVSVNQGDTLSVQAYTNNGCLVQSSDTLIVQVVPQANAQISASGATNFCAGDSVILSAAPGYQYLWSTGDTTQSITVLQSGNYSVQVSNSLGCSSQSVSTQVQVNSIAKPSLSYSGSTQLCAGSSLVLTAPAGYSSYLWNNGQTGASLTVNQSGTYYVQVSNASGCSSISDSLVVSVAPAINTQVQITGNTTLCAGDSVLLSAAPGYQYLWSTGDTTQSIWVSQNGNYQVSLSNTQSCSASSSPIAIQVSNLAAPVLSLNGPSRFCAGQSVQLSVPSGLGTYTWNTGASGPTLVVNQSGSYSVSIQDALGCTVSSNTVNITVDSLPAVQITAAANAFCAGDSLLLQGPASLQNYRWSTGDTTAQIWVYQSGSYTLQAENAQACLGTSAPFAVTVYPIPNAPNISFSASTQLLYSSAPSGNQWYFNDTIIAGATNNSYSPVMTGTYSVEALSPNGCLSERGVYYYVNIGLDEFEGLGLQLYPNPTKGLVFLKMNEYQQPLQIDVVDASGRLLLQQKIDASESEIDLRKLAPGNYIIRLRNEGRTIQQWKIQKL